MSVNLVLNQSSASLRNVPLPPLVQSNGTSACTNESGRTFYFSLGGVDYGSGGSLSVISAAMGLYVANFSASKISVTGQGFVYYGGPNSSLTALPACTPIEIIKVDSMNSQDYGLAAFSEVSIHAGTHSNVTIKGVQNAITADGTYSAVSVRIQAGDYGSINTFGVSNIKAGDYSSIVTVGVGIQSAAVQRSAASSIFSTDLGSGRVAQEFLWPLRNKITISGLTMTVYKPDDTTSAYTMSVTTSANALSGLDGGGRA